MIKAIETKFNGDLFRSRLEARWAIFFDALNIKYIYELEGYFLENGEKYLPDFFLPTAYHGDGCWVEIKPAMLDKWDVSVNTIPELPGIDKMAQLCRQTKTPAIYIYGLPWPKEYFVVRFYLDGNPEKRLNDFYMCLDCGLISIGAHGERTAFSTAWTHPYQFPCEWCDNPISDKTHGALEWAYTSARQARFEHRNSQNGTSEL